MASESPADRVPAGLLKHVHLLSAQQYPHTPSSLSLDNVLEQLNFAPRIVSSSKPVSWQYITPPQDGTIFLAWQPTAQLGNAFASDGYVFPEPETVLHQPCRGYTIEIFLNESGFILNHENVGTHRRVRYHLVAGPNGQPVDPALELVHYTQSPPNKHLPVSRMQHLDPHKQNSLKERSYLEGEGQLNRKEFMLYDKHNWPNISMPGRQAPAVPTNPYQRPGMPSYPGGFPPGMARPPGMMQGFPNQPRAHVMAPSPAKRQKMMPQQAPVMRMPELGPTDEEENAYIGDALDLLTPREISTTRYQQHHEWMEEILSSAYPVDRILPVELTYQLAGELGDLTKDLFTTGESKDTSEPRKIKEEQVAELEKRVAAFRSKGEEELTTMKARHKTTMEELSREQVWSMLEARLERAARGEGGETTEGVMQQIEREAGRPVESRAEVVRVRRGGMLDREETLAAAAARQKQNAEQQQQQQQQQQQAQQPGQQVGGGQGEGDETGGVGNDDFSEFANLDTAGEALDFYSGDYGTMGYGT